MRSILDCGCCIDEQGKRHWCPTCLGPAEDGRRRLQSPACERCKGTGLEPDWDLVGRHMRQLRKEKGLSLRELGSRVSCSIPHLSDLERGKRSWATPLARKIQSYLMELPDAAQKEVLRKGGSSHRG